jgi:branched-chain amino acid aminotransferase/4-amino-4-deoxychorismate lyase
MKAIYNGKLIDYSQIKLRGDDRGFRYGDGLFETMAVVHGGVRFLKKHFERIERGADVLDFDMSILNFGQLFSHCQSLIKDNGIDRHGKMKLYVWRRSGGLYQPEGRDINYMLSVEQASLSFPAMIESVGFSEKVVNFPTLFSSLKTMSALKYVVAGLEKHDNNFDEIIIKDQHGYVSETLYSNIFTKSNDRYFTPPVSTGCVEGVMRNWFIEKLLDQGYIVEEKCMSEAELLQAESVFTTNALGIRHILKIGDVDFKVDLLAQQLIESIS